MNEDFGDWGDEAFLGFCAEDWRDYAPLDADENLRRSRECNRLLEDEVDERDLFDIVREHDEQEDWLDEADDFVGQDISEFDESSEEYLNCSWEE